MKGTANQAVERMRGSAISSPLQSGVLGALPLIAHLTSLGCWCR